MANPATMADLERLDANEQAFHDWVNGAPNTTVTTPSGRVMPTMSTVVANLTTDGIMQDNKTQRQINAELMTTVNSVSGGYFTSTATLAELQAKTGMTTGQVAKVMSDTAANNGDYRYNGSAWVKGYDVLTDAKNYADANAVFKPLVNPPEKNLNNLGYGVVYYSTASDITTANNFPVASTQTYVLTYAANGPSVKYQRAVLVNTNPVRIFDRSYISSWSTWTENTNKAALDALAITVANNLSTEQAFEKRVFSKIGKNLLDKSKIVGGEYVSPSTSKISTSSSYRRSDFIPVVAGTTYTASGLSTTNPNIGWFANNDKTSTAISVTQTATATAPSGANYAVINILNDGTTNFDNTAQFEIGSIKTAYEAYKEHIALSDIENTSDFVLEHDILYNDSFNKIDPTKVDYVKRYSTALNFVTDTLGIAASDWIPVTEGEWYTVSGEYFGNTAKPQGGYFTSYGAATALQNIEWVTPVSGGGKAFKVPTGLGITHVVINIKKAGSVSTATSLNGNVQLEKGEMPTPYQEYKSQTLIKPELLPNQTTTIPSNGTFDDKAWYEYTQADGAKIYQDKLPKFRKAMLLKDKDVCVVMTGTSLTARTSEHSTLHKDASTRPPMMHSNAFCSYIWDALRWSGQQYRRYDASGFFTETGTFATSSNLSEWDDGAYRDGLTRYSSDATASVKFAIPVDAWQFNFIYRTDSVGCTAKITVAEGSGQLQVFDEATQAWVEANNYTFSQLEATPITRTVAIPSVISETPTNTTLASKGNTTYQKRLKMRCRSSDGAFDSRASAKNVTISRVGDGARFMYWGVEWSNREFMITFINSSRGSHNTNATGTSGLPRYQDNEVWGFKPDLILSELAIHNDGAAAAGVYPVGQWKQLAKHYVTNTAYELSLYSRAAYFNQSPEYAFFMGSITYNFGGINDDGSLKFGLQTASSFGSAKAMTALDKYQEAVQYLKEQDIPVIDTAQRWVDAGKAIFGDLKSATLGSGKNGATFTNEGSHWNDTGAKIVAKAVLPLIK